MAGLSHTPLQYLSAAAVTFAQGARCFLPAAVQHWPGKELCAGSAGWLPGWPRAPLGVAQEHFNSLNSPAPWAPAIHYPLESTAQLNALCPKSARLPQFPLPAGCQT